MKAESPTLPKATAPLAERFWAVQQRPSARRVARAMQRAGYPVHFVTISRWRAQNWKVKASDHPLELARDQIEAVALSTSIQDLIHDPAYKQDYGNLTDAETLRRVARETAIATVLVARAIQDQATAAKSDLLGMTPAVVALGRAVEALPDAFQQTIDLERAGQGMTVFQQDTSQKG